MKGMNGSQTLEIVRTLTSKARCHRGKIPGGDLVEAGIEVPNPQKKLSELRSNGDRLF